MESKKLYEFEELFVPVFNAPIVKRSSLNPRALKFITFASLLPALQLIFTIITRLMFTWEELGMNSIDTTKFYGINGGCVMTIFIAISILCGKATINNMLNELHHLFPVTMDEQHSLDLQFFAKKIIRSNNFFKYLVLATLSAYSLYPLCVSLFKWAFLNDGYVFVFPYWPWYSLDKSAFLSYVLFYCFQVSVIVACAYIYVSEEILYSNLITQLCMHYRYLCTSISQLDARNESETCGELRKLIALQCELDEICSGIDKTFSWSLFVRFSVGKIIPCLFFIAILRANSFYQIPVSIMSIVGVSLPVFQRCVLGQHIYEANENLLNAIYDHNWYEGTPRYRKTILIMMIRANKNLELHAGMMGTITLEFFKEIAFSTYEIFTFMCNFIK